MIKKISVFGITDVGRARTHNEDDFAICKDLSKKEWGFKRDEVLSLSEKGALLIVADGMGGTNAGEVASHIAQETVKEGFDRLDDVPGTASERENILATSVIKAHQAVVNHQHDNLDTAGMGSTLVIAWIIGDSVHVAWSGDSRCYIYNGQSALYPFTEDHSLVWQMVEEGKMTPEQARVHPESNIVIQSLGDEKNPPKPSVKSAKLYKENRLILCSDGLNGMLSDGQMQEILQQNKTLHETCDALVGAANDAGGEDNITCLMLEVVDGAEASAEDLDSQYAEKSKPSTTRILRTKNYYKNVIIAVLVFAVSALAYWVFPRNTPDPIVPVEKSAPAKQPVDTLRNEVQASAGVEESPADPVTNSGEETVPEIEESKPEEEPVDNDMNPGESGDTGQEKPIFPINKTPLEKPTPAEKDSLKNGIKPVGPDSTLNYPEKKSEAVKDTLSGSDIHQDSTASPATPLDEKNNTTLIDSLN